MDEGEALAAFVDGDGRAAQVAFDRLCAGTRGYLHACLRERLPEPQDREDVLQQTYLRIWEARHTFRDMGVPAWRGYLKRTAFRCCVDQAHQATVGLSDEELERHGVPLEEAPFVEALAEAAAVGQVLRAADGLWLGLDPAVPREEHTRRLLAAQLFFLERAPWDSVARVLAGGGRPPTREELDAWLADPAVLRLLAYSVLHYPGERLAAHLLGDDQPGEQEPAGGWTDAEAEVIRWRYAHALLLEQILARNDCTLSRDEAVRLLDRCAARFPFNSQMRRLLAALGRVPGVRAREVCRGPGLWHRLVFQYGHMEDLPQKDTLDRVQSPASQVGYGITAGMLNVWLSNRRLLKRLAEYCLAMLGGGTDA